MESRDTKPHESVADRRKETSEQRFNPYFFPDLSSQEINRFKQLFEHRLEDGVSESLNDQVRRLLTGSTYGIMLDPEVSDLVIDSNTVDNKTRQIREVRVRHYIKNPDEGAQPKDKTFIVMEILREEKGCLVRTFYVETPNKLTYQQRAMSQVYAMGKTACRVAHQSNLDEARPVHGEVEIVRPQKGQGEDRYSRFFFQRRYSRSIPSRGDMSSSTPVEMCESMFCHPSGEKSLRVVNTKDNRGNVTYYSEDQTGEVSREEIPKEGFSQVQRLCFSESSQAGWNLAGFVNDAKALHHLSILYLRADAAQRNKMDEAIDYDVQRGYIP